MYIYIYAPGWKMTTRSHTTLRRLLVAPFLFFSRVVCGVYDPDLPVAVALSASSFVTETFSLLDLLYVFGRFQIVR